MILLKNSPTLYCQRGPNILTVFSHCPPKRTQQGALEVYNTNNPLLPLHQLLRRLEKSSTAWTACTNYWASFFGTWDTNQSEGFWISSSGTMQNSPPSTPPLPRGHPRNTPCRFCRRVTQQRVSCLFVSGSRDLTITVLQLNQQRGVIHEVIVVRDDVLMLQQGKDNDFVQSITTLLFWQPGQVHLLPHYKWVVLKHKNIF